jgi:hypothetical protein
VRYLLLNGGGMDTLAVAKTLRAEHPNDYIRSLMICMGLPNESRARLAARAITREYCDAHDELHFLHGTGGKAEMGMPLVGNLFGVPFYSLLVMSIGMSYGMRRSFQFVVTGMKTDAAGPGYMEAFQHILGASKPTMGAPTPPPKLLTPLMGVRNEVIHDIIKDDPLLNQTVSCNRAEPCGVCGKCELRIRLGVAL